ncbi:MAG: N-acyl homoserine lactonase family protein [Solirubrobacterales bacterium]|nr:N-acyl homoserine lactonase family protein [Solirubrobacterales bacterium]
MTLDVIHTARIPMPHDYVFRPAGRPLSRWWSGSRVGPDALDGPCLSFVIRHPSAGVILVDTGLHPDAHRSLADFGRPMRLVFRDLEPVGPPFDQQLRALGIEPEAVERVVMTHLHVDHTGAMRLLPNARFTCTRAEWTAAHRRLAAAKGYVAHHLPGAHRVQLIDPAVDGTRHGAFTHTVDLLGDGSIRLISTPGHTPGHLSVLVRTGEHGDVLLVGDAAYTRRSIDEDVLPLITDDDRASRTSMREIREHIASAPRMLVVPTHDPSAWHELRSASG